MLIPRLIVEELDNYIIGQNNAKKVIAVALRNRYRRMLLSDDIKDEIIPKNILMIGTTGVGKTEIARRLAKIFKLPFIKVEASKYTEVGFVGRDVESMVRDLANASFILVKNEEIAKNADKINERIEKIILEKILPPLPSMANDEKIKEYENSYEKMRKKFRDGLLDELNIEIEVSENFLDTNASMPNDMQNIQESFVKIIGLGSKKVKKEMKVKYAKNTLKNEVSDSILNMDKVKSQALERAQNNGIIFIDEIDKIAVSNSNSSRQDPSKEGVQRDLLPVVEGCEVKTKIGTISTEHILFIAAGAFSMSKPSDLIPELQGRFPLRVELDSLGEQELFEILSKTKNSLLKQYQELLKTENINLQFKDCGVRYIAKSAAQANDKIEDIGARRLHTIIEKVLEDVSYDIEKYSNQTVIIDEEFVKLKIDKLVENEDLAKYIL